LKGNITSDGTRSYGYDSENRLSVLGSAPYRYDALGRLYGAGSPLIVAYEDEGDRQTAERNPSTGATLRRHVFGPGADEPLVWYEGSGTATRRFLHSDERGSIVAATESSGALHTTIRYDEYGATQVNTSVFVPRFLYTGQRYFGGVGLYYYKARFYDPKLGRFLQPDPIGYGAGMNMYAYVGGDPVNFTDPTGLKKRCPKNAVDIVVYGDRGESDSGPTVTGGAALLGASRGHGSAGLSGGTMDCNSLGCLYSADILVTGEGPTEAPPPNLGQSGPANLYRAGPSRIRDPLHDGPLYHSPNRPSPPPSGPDFCGSTGSGGVPDSVGGTNISTPCATHDHCYASDNSQADCDAQLMYDIWDECDRQSRTMGCYTAGVVYWQALRLMGRPAYNAAQRDRRR
jgi:RHS repeat-associated protein